MEGDMDFDRLTLSGSEGIAIKGHGLESRLSGSSGITSTGDQNKELFSRLLLYDFMSGFGGYYCLFAT